MTQHPSLKESQKSGKFRSVLKRYEKIKELVEKEKWNEEEDSVYHLPKIKRIKFKVKKVKGPAEEAAPAEAAAAGEGAPSKEAVSAKEGAPAEGKKDKAEK